MPDRLVVCNTSPLLYLHQVGRLDLLRDLYGRVQIPMAVRTELQAGAELGVSVPDVEGTDSCLTISYNLASYGRRAI